ncbi:MAG: hypothetical protein Q9185_006385 [Variospora sp. 1 TL-2023]
MAAAENAAPGMVDPKIFEQLQANIDDDGRVREELRSILQRLERQVEQALSPVWPSIVEQRNCMKQLEAVASKYPYYKYNQIWTRDIQETIMIILFCIWLGGGGKPQGSLPTIEEVGSTLNVPSNVNDRDTFHITTEEYLHALISLIEELV